MGLFLAGNFDIAAQLGQHDLGHAVGARKMGDGVDRMGLDLYRPIGIVGFLPHVARQKAANRPNRIEMAVK